MANSTTPWTVRTTKRNIPASAPNSRMSRHAMARGSTRSASARRKSHQQTLTQIQFVPRWTSPSSEADLGSMPTTSRKPAKRPREVRSLDQKSTITQMDFLAKLPITPVDSNDEAMQLIGKDERVALDYRAIAQSGGVSDGPKQVLDFGGSGVKRKRMDRSVNEAEEYQPLKRKKEIGPTVDNGSRSRRRSSRIALLQQSASKINGAREPDGRRFGDMSKYRVHSAGPAVGREKATTTSGGDHDVISCQGLGTMPRCSSTEKHAEHATPNTPRRRKDTIPSSQSPESLQPITRRRNAFAPETPQKSTDGSPLQDRSVNILTRSMLTLHDHKVLSPFKNTCPLRQIVRESALTQENLELVDAQQNLEQYSLRATALSSANAEHASESRAGVPEGGYRTRTRKVRVDEELEIPETSQAELHQVHVSSSQHEDAQDTHYHTVQEYPDFLVRDFAKGNGSHSTAATPHVSNKDPSCTGPSTPRGIVTNGTSVHCEAEDNVAFSPRTPIANDTQFNMELATRVMSSPLPRTCAPRKDQPRLMGQGSSSSAGKSIPSSPPDVETRRQVSLPSITTIVPLNDLPSQTLPPMPTQPLIEPASLPHPSQISTQDPTQSCLPTSSMALPRSPSPIRSAPSAITIKDSSSIRYPLLDLPSTPRSQRHIDLGLDDFQFQDEDLEPCSSHSPDMIDVQESQVADGQRPAVDVEPVATDHEGQRIKALPMDPKRYDPRDLGISSSLLESLPGPERWSQGSFDDEPIT